MKIDHNISYQIDLPSSLTGILDHLIFNHAKPMIVGGVVRDYLQNVSSKKYKDYDIEVYNIPIKKLEKILSKFGKVQFVGKSFGVLKLNISDYEFDFSLPRTENKISVGHRGFEIDSNPNLSYYKASKRRDFTINAILYDYQSNKFIDKFNGISDLSNRLLRYVDEKSFIEDPLRVYRAIQFCARFDLEIEDNTFLLCKMLVPDLNELPKERVWEEFKKLLLKSNKPSIGLNIMKELGILELYFPELFNIINIIQDQNHHAEGDVWTHTLLVIDQMATLSKDLESNHRLILLLSALCHDLGKATTTKQIDCRIISYGHEDESVPLTLSLISRFTDDKRLLNQILPLVKYHYAPYSLYKQKAKKSAIRRLSVKLGIASIQDLVLLAETDYFGRISTYKRDKQFKARKWIIDIASKQNILESSPKALVQGRDLIKIGLKPSKKFKKILNKAFDLQIDNDKLTKDEIISQLLDKIIF